jgi:lipoprotein-anchoring transpeptidase ErfK/SrfK
MRYRMTRAVVRQGGRNMMNKIFSSRLINVAGLALASSALFFAIGTNDAEATGKIVARIDISKQRMMVLVDGRETFEWKVSTAGKGYVTPTGSFKPTRMHKMWYSRKYDNAPMPHSVFFHGGYAVHATPHVKRLGSPASHGCIRLHPDNASDVYQLVQAFGPSNTSIVIVN